MPFARWFSDPKPYMLTFVCEEEGGCGWIVLMEAMLYDPGEPVWNPISCPECDKCMVAVTVREMPIMNQFSDE
jgi:hypothetical protein